MANFYQDGRHLDYIPAAETAVGALVEIGGTIGIVDPTNHGGPLAAGELGSVSIGCVVEVDNGGVDVSMGDLVGYTAATDVTAATTLGDFDIGTCVNTAATGTGGKVHVLLFTN